MGRVSVDKFKSAMTDHFLHKRLGALFPSRLRPPTLLANFFRETDAFINNNKHVTERPMGISSLFPSLFDGIRLGRRHTTAPYLKQTNDKDQHKSSNCRIIPIKIHHDEKTGKSKSLNEANPIVLDDDEAEMIDMTEESSASQFAQSRCTSHRKPTKVDSAITVDDDSHVYPLRQSVESCAEVKKGHVRRSSPIEIVESASTSPKSKKPNWHNSHSEKNNLQASNGSMVWGGRMRTGSVITLDDDQETIHLDDISQDSESLVQQSSDSAGFKKETAQKAALIDLESELKTSPNEKSNSIAVHNLELNNTNLGTINIENKDGIHLSDTEIPKDPGFSSLSTTDCRVEELKDSPPPGHPTYEELMRVLANENRKIHYITGDGNCFFRALCKILYGSETYHKAVRSLIVDIIATNKNKFAQFVDENDVQGHVEKMAEDHCWATTCEIYAAATVLQRDIYVLTPNHLNTNYSWLLFKPVFKITSVPGSFASHLCYITLCNTNGNHYDLVVADHGKCNCFLPHPELDGISASIDLT